MTPDVTSKVYIKCKLSQSEWINDKVLLDNTGNYTHYSVISHNEKDYICITEPLCSTAEINAT